MQKLYNRLGSIELFLSAVGLVACCVLIFIAALARAVGKPFNWSQDLSLFLFAWSVFLSADVALRKDKLVRVELLVDMCSVRIAKILSIFCYSIILCFLLALMYYGVKLAFISHKRVFQGIPGFSYSWVIVSIPIGSLLMAITSIRKLWLLLSGNSNPTDQRGTT